MGLILPINTMIEISYALIEDVVNTQVNPGGAAITPGLNTVTPGSMLAIYAGAQLVCGAGTDIEVISVISVTASTFTADFANAHPANDPLVGATFPSGQNDSIPLFTQSEMLTYLTEAQNSFLLAVQPIYTIATQALAMGRFIYPQPSDAIRMERVSIAEANPILPVILLDSTGQAWEVNVDNTGRLFNSKVAGTAPTFILINGASTTNTYQVGVEPGGQFGPPVVTVPQGVPPTLLVSPNGSVYQLQVGDAAIPVFLLTSPSSASVAGYASSVELWDETETSLDWLDTNWMSQTGQPNPSYWFQDKVGVGNFGVGPPPQVGSTARIFYSQRGPENPGLGLLTPYLVPDVMVPALKWRVLALALSKDGEQRNVELSKWAEQWYQMWCLIARKYLQGLTARFTMQSETVEPLLAEMKAGK
jgi:hypothetical protein